MHAAPKHQENGSTTFLHECLPTLEQHRPARVKRWPVLLILKEIP
jgi:hypothetical protein